MPNYDFDTAGKMQASGHNSNQTVGTSTQVQAPLATSVMQDLNNLQSLLNEIVVKTRGIADTIVGVDAKLSGPGGGGASNPATPPNGLLEAIRIEIRIAAGYAQVVYDELHRIQSKF